MEAVRSNRSHSPGSSLNKVGLSQLMWAEYGAISVRRQILRPLHLGRI